MEFCELTYWAGLGIKLSGMAYRDGDLGRAGQLSLFGSDMIRYALACVDGEVTVPPGCEK